MEEDRGFEDKRGFEADFGFDVERGVDADSGFEAERDPGLARDPEPGPGDVRTRSRNWRRTTTPSRPNSRRRVFTRNWL